MTKHVRSSYRRHRRATWGLAAALVLAIAAFAIPIASGAGEKTFTLAISPTCLPAASTTVTVKNTSSPQTLGSIQIYFPAKSIQSPPSGWTLTSDATSEHFSGRRDILARNNFNLASGATTTVVVPLKSTAPPGEVSAKGKQSNNFNDSGGGANLFVRDPSQTSWPQLVSCVTIEGRVYHDRDQSGAFAANPPNPATADIKKPGWTVTLQRQTGPTTFTPVLATDVSDADGLYDFKTAAGSTYRLCVKAPVPPPPAPDHAIAWAVRQIVPPVTLVSGCGLITPSSPSSRGISVALTTAGASGQDFAVVPVTVLDFDGGDTAGSGNYVVTAGGDSDKVAQHYVQETWTSNGRPFFVFAPINKCTGTNCGQIYLLEHLQGSIAQSALGATKQVSLVYDDTEPFQIFNPMSYCLRDPRGATATDLLTEDVLPAGETSCIVEGRQKVRGNGTLAGAFVDFEFFVYSNYDGGRGMG